MPFRSHSPRLLARTLDLTGAPLWAFAQIAGVACAFLVPMSAAAFGFDDVAKLAKDSSEKSYVAPAAKLPADLASFDYDRYRDIRFKPEQALWRKEGLPFEVMFYHLGFGQKLPVLINEVAADKVRRIPFDPAEFDYGANKPGTDWGDLGFAGFRIHYPLNQAGYKDELAVFMGASYLRVVGKNQHYGLSARGLAIDTVGGKGEEFPRFTQFWIERPAVNATSLTLYALLDSPRAAGAYQFTLHPGDETVTDVKARVFLRAPVANFEIAALTSMYQHGENEPSNDDFRPEVHDSDGLMISAADGEWLWRPLQRVNGRLVTSFKLKDPKGFGLMQRDHSFSNYEDAEARYERRPSAWVEPLGTWGSGRVELMQFPTPHESDDNVVAYWVPEQAPAPRQPFDFAYRVHWQGEKQQRPPNGWATQSRRGRGATPLAKGEYQYVVDFDGPSLSSLAAGANLDADVTVGSAGRLVERNAYRNPANGGWRMTMRIKRTSSTQPIELRAFLKQGNNALTETWTTLIPID
jgi:glucans biosynthesis protein